MFATFHSHGSWNMEIHPVNRRPLGTPAFECIQRGDVVALQRALDTGELSIWDVTRHRYLDFETTLLGV